MWPLLNVFDALLFGRPGVFIQKLRKKKSTVAVTVWCTSVDFVLLLLIRQGHAGVSLQRKCIWVFCRFLVDLWAPDSYEVNFLWFSWKFCENRYLNDSKILPKIRCHRRSGSSNGPGSDRSTRATNNRQKSPSFWLCTVHSKGRECSAFSFVYFRSENDPKWSILLDSGR